MDFPFLCSFSFKTSKTRSNQRLILHQITCSWANPHNTRLCICLYVSIKINTLLDKNDTIITMILYTENPTNVKTNHNFRDRKWDFSATVKYRNLYLIFK